MISIQTQEKTGYKFLQLLCGILYAISYNYIYKEYMFPVWGYMGAEYLEMSNLQFGLYVMCAAVPLYFYQGFRTLASGISLVEYVLVFVPILLAVQTTKCMRSLEGEVLFVELLVAQIVIFKTDQKVLLKSLWTTKKRNPIAIVEIITILLILVLIVEQGGRIHFVNFFQDSSKMYELRVVNSDSRSVFSGYLLNWVNRGFLPFLMVVYLIQKNKIKILLSVIGFVVMYMLDMQKITLIMPFVMIFFYKILKGNWISRYFQFIFILLFTALPILSISNLDNTICYTITAILVMRTQCVAGWLSSIYFNFFQSTGHPFTYYGHINIVNWLTGVYPYGNKPLGVAVAEGSMNANANFLLTDGYAAFGILGIAIAVCVFILVKSILNGICTKYDSKLCFIAFFPAISAMMNASIFSAILTNGMLLLFILFLKFDFCSNKK